MSSVQETTPASVDVGIPTLVPASTTTTNAAAATTTTTLDPVSFFFLYQDSSF